MDANQFIEEVKKNKSQMYTLAYSIVKNTADTEDVIQEALLHAYEKLYTLRQDDKFKSWMMRIVVNQAKMYIRKNRKTVYMDRVEDMRAGSGEEKQEDIWEIVLSLDSELSSVVILYYAQGYSVREISKIIRIPSGTVKSRLARARILLEKELEDWR